MPPKVGGRDITPRHDVDKVLMQLRKADVENPGKKMKWLQSVFKGETPEKIYDRSKQLYEAASHEHRDVSPRSKKPIDLGKVERPILFKKDEGSVGEHKSPEAISEMQDAVTKALKAAGMKEPRVSVQNESPVNYLKGSRGYMSPTGKMVLNATRHGSVADAVYTAFHEAYHRGELGTEAKPYQDALVQARRNSTVDTIARQLEGRYGGDTHLATREALAEINAAAKSGDWATLQKRYGVSTDGLLQGSAKGALGAFISKAKQFFQNLWSKITGKPVTMTDAQVRDMTDHIFGKANEPVQNSFKDLMFSKEGPSKEQWARKVELPESADKIRDRILDRTLKGEISHADAMDKIKTLADRYATEPYERPQLKRHPDSAPLAQTAEDISSLNKREQLNKARNAVIEESKGNKSISAKVKAWTRFSLLSYMHSPAKILSTSVTQILDDMIKEKMQGFAQKFIPKNVFEAAQRQREGWNSDIESRARKAMFNKDEYKEVARTGHTSLEKMSDRLKQAFPDMQKEQPELYARLMKNESRWQKVMTSTGGLLSVPGRTHAIIHTPPMLAEYERSLSKRLNNAVADKQLSSSIDLQDRDGLMKRDPLVYLDAHTGALSDALSSAFRGETAIGDLWEKGIDALRNKHANGAADLFEVLNPFMIISSNVLTKTVRKLGGGFAAASEYKKYKNNVNWSNKVIAKLKEQGAHPDAIADIQKKMKLPANTADFIISATKDQGIGVAAILLGAALWPAFGGMWNKKDYGRKDMPEAGDVALGSHTVPKFLLEHPMYQAMQSGATMGRAIAESTGAKGRINAGLGAAGDIASGILENSSVDRSMQDLHKALSGTDGIYKWLAQFATSRMIPGAILEQAKVQELGKTLSPDSSDSLQWMMGEFPYLFMNDPIHHKQSTVGQYAEGMVPKTPLSKGYNRQLVPTNGKPFPSPPNKFEY